MAVAAATTTTTTAEKGMNPKGRMDTDLLRYCTIHYDIATFRLFVELKLTKPDRKRALRMLQKRAGVLSS